MNDQQAISGIWLIRVISIALLACVVVRAVPEVSAAYRLRLASLAAAHFVVSVALSAAWLFAEGTLRGGVRLSRWGIVVLLIASSCALAVGNSPGLFLPSLGAAALFVLLLAIMAALCSGTLRTVASRAAIVLFCGTAGAAWQVGAMPLIATLILRN